VQLLSLECYVSSLCGCLDNNTLLTNISYWGGGIRDKTETYGNIYIRYSHSVSMVEKLDIHNSQKNFDYYYSRLDNCSMSRRQVNQIKKFVLEAQIGKNSKKKVGTHRLIANLQSFFKLHGYFKKDFDKITEKEIVKFYQDLEADRIKQKSGKPYKNSSKDELIRNLKRYLKCVWKEDVYNKKARWLKEYDEIPEIPALSMKDCEKLSEGMKFLRDQTITIFLADSGCRIEETLNLKISDISKKEKTDEKGNPTGEEFYIVNIRISKTLPRKISIPIASKTLTLWLSEHPSILDKDAYLFPCTYDGYRKVLRDNSKRILQKVVTPHLLRHSSASHYCKIINNPYKFCYRYGWHFNSKMARRYIDRSQLEEDAQEQLDNLIKGNKVEELEKEMKKQREELFNVVGKMGIMETLLHKVQIKNGLKPTEVIDSDTVHMEIFEGKEGDWENNKYNSPQKIKSK